MLPVNLSLAREPQSPTDFFLAMSAACKEFDIAAPDVYGDFSLTKESSYLRKFEAEVADFIGEKIVGRKSFLCVILAMFFTGMEDAIFAPSGVMAQEMVLCMHRYSSYFICRLLNVLLDSQFVMAALCDVYSILISMATRINAYDI